MDFCLVKQIAKGLHPQPLLVDLNPQNLEEVLADVQRVGAALDDALAAPPARRVGAALQDGLAAAQSQGARLPLLPLMEERLELLRQDGQAAWPELSTQQVGGYPLWQIVAISAGVSALVAASVPPEDQQR